MQVDRLGREPLLHDPDRRLRLRLRLGQEVAVEVEAVAVRARARDAAVRVLDHVEDDDRRRRGSRRPRGRRRTASSRAARSMRMFESTPSYSFPWMLPWMKSGTLTRSRQARSCRCAAAGLRERLPAQRRPVVEGRLLRVRLQLVDHDLVERAAGGGRAVHLEAHAAVEAARLDVCERAADRVDRDVREARAGRRQRLRRVRFGCSAPGRCDRGGGGAREADERGEQRQQE